MIPRLLLPVLSTCLLLAEQASEPCYPLEEDRIYGRHLAAVLPLFGALPSDASLGYTPLPGVQRVFTVAQLEQLARRYGLQPVGLRPVCFERAAERLRIEEIRRAMEMALPGVEIDLVDYLRAPVPRGQLEFPLSGLVRPREADPQTVVLWKGLVRYGEHRTFPVWARVRLAVTGQAVVAARALEAGRMIQPGDVELRTMRRFPSLGKPELEDLQTVFGAKLRRAVAAGQVIQAEDLDLVQSIRAGSTVRVSVISGGAEIRFEAQAETAGRVGDRIWVRNPMNGRRFQARVVGPGSVELVVGGDS